MTVLDIVYVFKKRSGSHHVIWIDGSSSKVAAPELGTAMIAAGIYCLNVFKAPFTL